MVTVEDKREFVQWFLNTYQLKRRECVWIINYLVSSDMSKLLEKTHFVENTRFSSKGLYMSTHCLDMPPFRYYKEEIMTTDAEKAFHDIRRDKSQDIYIELDFINRKKCPQWVGIREDNPFYKEEFKVGSNFNKIADNLVTNLEFTRNVSLLDREIDDALFTGNRDKFLTLSETRKELLSVKPPKLYETARK